MYTFESNCEIFKFQKTLFFLSIFNENHFLEDQDGTLCVSFWHQSGYEIRVMMGFPAVWQHMVLIKQLEEFKGGLGSAQRASGGASDLPDRVA